MDAMEIDSAGKSFIHSSFFCCILMRNGGTNLGLLKIGKDEEGKAKPVMVILIGAPGSGKSTFCDLVMRVSTRPWIRICQVSSNFAISHVLCFPSNLKYVHVCLLWNDY